MAGDGTIAKGAASLLPTLVFAFVQQGKGKTQKRSIPVGGLLLGRGSVVFDNAFEDPRMSRRHAEVRLEAGRPVVRDLRSGRGTLLNGHALLGPRALDPGDVIRLGDTLLVYALSAATAAAKVSSSSKLIGDSAAIVEVRRSIDAVADHALSVVISGETGTGKELVARLVHQGSGRSGRFAATSCGGFSEAVLSNELFGHVRGAFSGAVNARQGLFFAARGGTVLLDEVTETPLPVQGSLLRVLETRQVRPLGGTRDVTVDVRVIATSKRELVELVQAGHFRADLYSRLAQWTIRLPPLRARREDIAALTREQLARCNENGRALSADLAEALLLHEWPLNVRGLFNVVSVAVICATAGQPLSLGTEVRDALVATRTLGSIPQDAEPPVLGKAELKQTLARFHGKVAAAARHLQVTRPKLYRMLWAHDVDPAQFR
jgi:DNA-binding NtrC family response regulator